MIINSIIEGGASASGVGGTGISVSSCTNVSINDSIVTGNSGSFNGQGIAVTASVRVLIDRSEIVGGAGASGTGNQTI